MPSFKDRNSREWSLSLDGPTIKRIRSEHDGIDLADVEGKSAMRLVDDPCLLVDVLWSLCKKQAEAAGISDEQFGQALVGEAIEHATNALLEAITDFFPKARSELMRAAHRKQQAISNLGIQKALGKINDPALEAKILADMEQQMDAAIASALTRLSSVTS